jgi:hypothetical protein
MDRFCPFARLSKMLAEDSIRKENSPLRKVLGEVGEPSIDAPTDNPHALDCFCTGNSIQAHEVVEWSEGPRLVVSSWALARLLESRLGSLGIRPVGLSITRSMRIALAGQGRGLPKKPHRSMRRWTKISGDRPNQKSRRPPLRRHSNSNRSTTIGESSFCHRPWAGPPAPGLGAWRVLAPDSPDILYLERFPESHEGIDKASNTRVLHVKLKHLRPHCPAEEIAKRSFASRTLTSSLCQLPRRHMANHPSAEASWSHCRRGAGGSTGL